MKENDLKKIADFCSQIEKTFPGAHLSDFRYMLESAETIWMRCPFKVNDRVVLVKTPEITPEKSWGWMGAKHFLIEGAKAKIVERDFRNGTFGFGLHFDDESWIHHMTKAKMPVDRPAQYWFGESWLRLE